MEQISKSQFEKVLAYIESGKKEGATLVTGGKACGTKGYYIEPTIFADVKVFTHMFLNLIGSLYIKFFHSSYRIVFTSLLVAPCVG